MAALASEVDECPICLEPLEDLPEDPNFQLPCNHRLHTECVKGLRKSGVSQACPLCRAAIPPGPEQLYEEALLKYVKDALTEISKLKMNCTQN